MSWRGERRGHLTPWLAALVLCLGLAWIATAPAGAAPPQLGPGKIDFTPPEVAGPPAPGAKQGGKAGGGKRDGGKKGGGRGGGGGGKKGGGTGGPSGPIGPTPTLKELGESGQVDPISGLGLRNPVCDKPGQIRATKTRLSCQMNGTPEGTYPTTNYGFDIFIDTGIDSLDGTLAKGLVMVLNGIWLGLIFILKLVLALLGLAFGLNPFAKGGTMRDIAAALSRVYRAITDPWLSVVIVAGGIWFAYRGLLRRDLAASVGGTLVGIAMLIVGLWVIHQPSASVGRLAKAADEVAVTIISAPRSGSLSRPTGTYAEAMAQTWSQLVEVPFAGLNFSDVRWAMGPPPPEAVERANVKLCDDVGALVLMAILTKSPSVLDDAEAAAKACEQFARKRYGKPRRVIDLYLRSSPGSPARKELWQYFDKDEGDKYKSKVAAQGGDGVLTRLSMLALFALGLAGALMLLAWLAIRLFTQAAIAFVLLLTAPFAVLFPMLGDSGRRAFKTWGLALIGATVAKIVYAAILSIVLLGMTILGRIGDATGFLLACAFAWSVFLKRGELIGWMSIGEASGGQGGSPIGSFLAFSGARRVLKSGAGAVSGVARKSGRVAKRHWSDGSEATAMAAQSKLDEGARGLANIRHREAAKTVAAYEGRYGAGDALGGKPGKGAGTRSSDASRQGGRRSTDSEGRGAGNRSQADARSSGAEGESPTAKEKQRYEKAKQLVDHARENREKTGDSWTAEDLEKFGAENREQLRAAKGRAQLSGDELLDHAHRANFERHEVEKLKGEERQQAERAIAKGIERDLRRDRVASEPVGRVVGRVPRAAERYQQWKESGLIDADRTKAKQGIRAERRERMHDARRRNLSRGS